MLPIKLIKLTLSTEVNKQRFRNLSNASIVDVLTAFVSLTNQIILNILTSALIGPN